MQLQNYFKTSLPFSAAFAMLFVLSSCGSSQYVGQDNDGIYGSDTRVETTDKTVATETQPNYYKNYFKGKSIELDNATAESEVFTDVDSYQGNYTEIDSVAVERQLYGGWGDQNNGNVTVNVINTGFNNWGWNDPFWGWGWNRWNRWNRWNSWNYGWGWNTVGFYDPFWCPPYYGGFYGNPYVYGYGHPFYNRGVVYNRGRRNLAYNNRLGNYYNRRSVLGNRSRINTTRPRTSITRPRTVRPRTNIGRPRTNTVRPRTNIGRPRTVRPRTNTVRPRTVRPRTNTVRPRTSTPRPRYNSTPRPSRSYSSPSRSMRSSGGRVGGRRR